jgi:hypothetical protein
MAMTLRQDAAGLTWEKVRSSLRQPPLAVWLAAWGALVAVQLVSPLWYATHDASRYLSIARSTATTGQPTNLGSPHLVYGAGYPLLISPAFLFGPYPFLWLSAAHALMAALYLAGVYVWARRYVPEAAVPFALLAVGNCIVLTLLRRPLSEAAFLPVMIWAASALTAIPGSRAAWRPVLAAAVLLSFLAVIRQAGVLFAVGFALHLALRAWRGEMSWARVCILSLAVGLPPVLAAGAMVAYDREMAARASAWSNMDIFTRSEIAPRAEYPEQPLFLQCLEGVRLRVSEAGRLLIPGMFNAYGAYRDWLNVNLLWYFALAGVLVVGWWRFVRRLDVLALTLPFYAALHVYWPFDQSGRYFAPMLPVLFVCLWHGLAGLRQRRLALFTALVVLHTGVALGYWLAVDRPRALDDDRRWPDARRLAEVIRAAPGSVQVGPDLGKTHLLLEYVLDRPVAWQEAGRPPAAGAQWLVTAAGAVAPADFEPVAEAGEYRLWQRRTGQAAITASRVVPARPAGFARRKPQASYEPGPRPGGAPARWQPRR